MDRRLHELSNARLGMLWIQRPAVDNPTYGDLVQDMMVQHSSIASCFEKIFGGDR